MIWNEAMVWAQEQLGVPAPTHAISMQEHLMVLTNSYVRDHKLSHSEGQVALGVSLILKHAPELLV